MKRRDFLGKTGFNAGDKAPMRIQRSLAWVSGCPILLAFLGCLIVTAGFTSAASPVCQTPSHEEILEKMMDIAGVKPGMVIGEVGAGGGDLAFRLAERVGADGIIYANDIHKGSLDYIDKKQVRNIETVLGETDDPAFPVKNLDMVIMKNVFHDLENPLSLLENLKKYLKEGAPFVLIEAHRSKEDKKTAMSFHDMTKEQLLSVVKKSSFEIEQPEAFLPSRWSIYTLKVDEKKKKSVWANWLSGFHSVMKKVNDLEKDKNISLAKKRIAWVRALDSYRDNNPETEEDERLREYMIKRIESLKKQEGQSGQSHKGVPVNNTSGGFAGIRLRAEYKTVDDDRDYIEILERLGFEAEFRVRSGDFPNQFEPESIEGDEVVVDRASGLMWHQSGSEEPLDFFTAQEWTEDINIQKYAGYSDWRLPTVEELLSLIETDKMNGDARIDPLFSSVQSVIWTGDEYYPGRAWAVNFSRFTATLWYILKINASWVRPVRSLR